ncbi:MAG: GyrI-like domain-containing protein [Bacteroidota bacterium]
MRRKYVIQVLVVATIIGLGGYSWLGGWRKVAYTTVSATEPYALVGYFFEGDYDDPQLGRNFREIREYKESGALKGDFAVAYWLHPEDYEGRVQQMIGIMYPASEVPESLPQGLEVKTLPGSTWAKATLTNHVAVMPSPKKVRERLREYASQESLPLDTLSIEKYYSDWHLEILIPASE